MGTGDTYSGGGSIVRIGKDGLEWTSLDPAENKQSHSSSKRPGNRAPTRTEIEQQSQEADRQEAKLIRSLISRCATAYAAEKLDASRPEPPKQLKAPIKNSRANVPSSPPHPTYPT